MLILLTDTTERNPCVQYESRCTSEMCGIYLLALYTHRYLPVTSSVCLPATHLCTCLPSYLHKYLSTHALTYLPIYLSVNPIPLSIHPSKYLYGLFPVTYLMHTFFIL